jgi:hypothetical protein
MSTLDFTPLYHSTVGFDRLPALLAQALERDESGYPTYNIEKTGEDAYRIMDQGLDYLQRIHYAVVRAAERKASDDPMQICKEAIRDLGLPEMMANPLVCRSFLSSLKMPE